MLNSLFGSNEAEKVLAFIAVRDSGYAYEMAKFFDANLRGIQKQLVKFEGGGVLVSRKIGRTRLYSFNPRFPLKDELAALVKAAISFYPDEMIERLQIRRERPRRQGKPA